MNKWDLLAPPNDSREGLREYREAWLDNARAELFFMSFAPLDRAFGPERRAGQPAMFNAIEKTRRAAAQKIGTGPLNRLLHAAVELQPPAHPRKQAIQVDVRHAAGGANHVSRRFRSRCSFCSSTIPRLLVDSYHKYLENKLRETFPFPGLPVILKQRGRASKEAGA